MSKLSEGSDILRPYAAGRAKLERLADWRIRVMGCDRCRDAGYGWKRHERRGPGRMLIYECPHGRAHVEAVDR